MTKQINTDNIKTKIDAVQYAIDVQTLISEKDLSYGELLEYQTILEKLARKFHLIKEFKENGLI